MSNIILSKYAIEILKIIRYKATSINDLARDFDRDPISNDIGGYMVYLYEQGYIKKNKPFDENGLLSLSDKTILTVKGIEYLRALKQDRWSFIKKSILTPIFITAITFILCKYLENYF